MPHSARKVSQSGYYHVVSKGIGDQLLFEDDLDRRYYIGLLAGAKDCSNSILHAYCLMGNHIHIVVEAANNNLARFMKYVDERYGMYFSDKTGRSGGIFKKPYWSEPIESDEYLLCAVRYVHANPAVAGICPASAYEWSSAKDYLGRQGITDTSTILDMCGGIRGFIEFSRMMPGCARAFPGSKLLGHITDDEANTIATLTLGKDSLRELGIMEPFLRDEGLRRLKNSGLTMRQISRITGLGIRTVQLA